MIEYLFAISAGYVCAVVIEWIGSKILFKIFPRLR